MPVSSDIYGMVGRGVQPVNDPLNSLTKALQVQGLQQDQQLGSMKMDEYQRGVQQKNKLLQLLSGDYASDDARAAALTKGGFYKEGGEILKNRADIQKQGVETDAKRLETAHKKLDLVGQSMGWVKENPTPENALAVIDSLVSQGIFTAEQAAKGKQDVMANPTPENVQRLATMAYQSALSTQAQLPQIIQRSLGGTNQVTAVSPVTQKASVIASDTVTETDAQRLEREQRARDAAAGRGVQMQIAKMVDERSRDATAATREATAGNRIDSQTQQIAKMVESQALPNLSASMRTLNTTLEKYKDGELPGVGRVTGYLPPMMLGEEGKKVRSQAQGVANDLLKLYSGGAVTLNESERRTIEMMQGGGFTQKDLYNAWPTIVNRYNEAVKNIEAGFAPAAVETFKKRGGSALTPITPATPTNKGPSASDLRQQADNILRGG